MHRLILSIFLIVTVIGNAYASSEALPDPSQRFPVTHFAKEVAEAKRVPEEWKGRAAAIEGSIEEIRWRTTGEPSLLLKLSDSSETIWVEFLAPMKNFTTGATIRVLGFFAPLASLTAKDDVASQELRARTSDGSVFLGYCALNPLTNMLSARGQQMSFCALWQKGKLPEDIR